MLKLASAVASAAGVSRDEVMLLRHSNTTVAQLLDSGSTIEEYTEVQPIGSRYDYLDDARGIVSVVAVIVNDCLYAVYRVLGVLCEGSTYSLTSSAHRDFNRARGKMERPARKYKLEAIQNPFLGAAVTGWESRERTTVQRANGGFFDKIEINFPASMQRHDEIISNFESDVLHSIHDAPELRRRRLALAPKQARSVQTTTTVFLRNPDVVAEVLVRAAGICELCGAKAPFQRRSDGMPYLEVHHCVRLADGGDDTVQNAIAICPNCHRRKHYG